MKAPGLAFWMVLAVVLRCAIPLLVATGGEVDALHTTDTARYLELAASLVAGQGYATTEGPEVFRPPGYPLLLAVGLCLGAPVGVTIALQALLGAWTCALVHRAASELTGAERAGRVAAAWVAIDPVLVAWAGRLMAETALAAAMAAVALGLVRLLGGRRGNGLAWLAGGIAAGAYFKPIAALLPGVVGFLLLAFPGPRVAGERRPADAILAAVLPLALLLPWVVRNGIVVDYWWFSSQFDRIVSFTAPAAVQARRESRPFSAVRAEIARRQQPPGYEARGYAAVRREGVSGLVRDLPGWAHIHAAGMARVLFSPGAQPLHEPFRSTADVSAIVLDRGIGAAALEMMRGRPGLWVTEVALLPLLLALLARSVAGAVAGSGSLHVRCALSGTVLALLALSGGPWGQSRFRAPLVPLLAVLAGCAAGRHDLRERPDSR